MLDYLTIEDYTGADQPVHETPTRALVNAEGLAGLTKPRVVALARAGRSGTRSRTRFRDARIISLTGEVWGSGPHSAETELYALQGLLADAVDTPRLCKYRLAANGLELQTLVRLESDLKPDLSGPGSFVPYSVSLRADEPRAFTQRVYTASSAPMGRSGGGVGMPTGFPAAFEPSSAGLTVIPNTGSAKTPAVFRLYGRLVNPVVRLGTDGPEVAINGTVAAGSYLEIDTDARTVTLNGQASRLYLRDPARTRWFELPRATPGSDPVVLRLLADDADAGAYMQTFYRRAYG